MGGRDASSATTSRPTSATTCMRKRSPRRRWSSRPDSRTSIKELSVRIERTYESLDPPTLPPALFE
ncbi:MAG: hypothetical protein MZV63_13435 [Marinilabiliales bacterium]|nr:hypothetical protein [Marinilabiliales bacterium]